MERNFQMVMMKIFICSFQTLKVLLWMYFHKSNTQNRKDQMIETYFLPFGLDNGKIETPVSKRKDFPISSL